jgi:hypothetical protein
VRARRFLVARNQCARRRLQESDGAGNRIERHHQLDTRLETKARFHECSAPSSFAPRCSLRLLLGRLDLQPRKAYMRGEHCALRLSRKGTLADQHAELPVAGDLRRFGDALSRYRPCVG